MCACNSYLTVSYAPKPFPVWIIRLAADLPRHEPAIQVKILLALDRRAETRIAKHVEVEEEEVDDGSALATRAQLPWLPRWLRRVRRGVSCS